MIYSSVLYLISFQLYCNGIEYFFRLIRCIQIQGLIPQMHLFTVYSFILNTLKSVNLGNQQTCFYVEHCRVLQVIQGHHNQ